jgi:hypothetical protein
MVVARIRSSLIFKKLVDQGLAALTTEDFARHRLEAAADWTDLLVDTFQKVLDDWQAQQRLQIKPSKLIGVPHAALKTIQQKT